MSCWFSASTVRGKMELGDIAAPVYAFLGGTELHVADARALRELEAAHGRVLLVQRDRYTGEVLATAISAHATNARTKGATELERRYGPTVVRIVTPLTEAGAAPGAVHELAHAVAAHRDPASALRAVKLAAPLICGRASRWARQLRDELHRNADAAGLAAELELLRRDAFGEECVDGVAGGLALRDFAAARRAAAVARAFQDGGGQQAPQHPEPVLAAAARMCTEVLEHAQRARHWAYASKHDAGQDDEIRYRVRSESMSGYKVHVYCADFEDVTQALGRLSPVLVERGLSFKIAAAGWARWDSGAESQARKGITVYFPQRDELIEDARRVGAAMAGWHHHRAPGDDLWVMPGVGLRYELVADFGGDVTHDQYASLYCPAGSLGLPTIVMEVAEAVQRRCHDGGVSVDALTEWMWRSYNLEWYDEDHPKGMLALLAAAELAAAGIDPRTDGGRFDAACRGAQHELSKRKEEEWTLPELETAAARIVAELREPVPLRQAGYRGDTVEVG